MVETSDTQKTPQAVSRKRRFLWWAASIVILLALGAWAVRTLFSVIWFLPFGLAIVALTAVVILWKVPQWQVRHVQGLESKERFDRVNEARKTLATILGGIVLLAGFFGTWQNLKVAQEKVAQETLRVSQEGQITDRFTKAIEQLGAVNAKDEKKMVVRLGGIYALERIAAESERDHWPIMEVLCTYVRNVAPIKRQQSTREKQASSQRPNSSVDEHPEADVQAILTVLGRRDSKYERLGQYLNLSDTNVTGAYLSGANLRRAYLSGANLGRADLSGADLSGAYLSDADLSGASLVGATLSGAYFGGANLRGADLSGAYLSGAYLSGAYLSEAHLFKANLRGAYLSEAKNLTQQQIDEATGDATTTLPANLHVPESWRK